MKIMKVSTYLFLALCSLFFFIACNDSKKEKVDTIEEAEVINEEVAIDVPKEIEQWRQDLISGQVLGKECDFEDDDIEARQDWANKNQDQLDGFPSDPNRVGVARADFDRDGEEDVFLYFNSENCTGHNGSTPSFAKIIYGNGESKEHVQDDIIKAVQQAYKKKREEDKSLLEVTDNYFRNTLTIDYRDDSIMGQYRLYRSKDAHCCPTYIGTYHYDPGTEMAEIEVNKAEK